MTAATSSNRIQRYLARRFVTLLSQDPTGVPPWLPIVARGDGPGLFLPDDAPWVVHADFATFVGGVRALLIQALHPGSLAGVREHSRYQADPVGRLAGTIRWLTITTFGSVEAVQAEAGRVNRLHQRVTGEYRTARGETRRYAASDPDLLLWVHIAFTESFLRAHQNYSRRPIPGGADAYVRLWAKSVEPLGLHHVPLSEAALRAEIQRFKETGELAANADTAEVVRFLRRPPLGFGVHVVYAALFRAAVATIPREFLDLLGVKPQPLWLWRPVVRSLLILMRWAVGPDSPVEDAARDRLARAKRIDPPTGAPIGSLPPGGESSVRDPADA